MRATDNKNLIHHYFDAVTGKSFEHSLDSFFSENISWHLLYSHPLIHQGPQISRTDLVTLINLTTTTFQPNSMDITLHKLIADDKNVAVQLTLNAILNNGNYFEHQFCFTFSIYAGKINGIREVACFTYLMSEQLEYRLQFEQQSARM